MRPMLAALMLAFGLIGMVDPVFASIYVPGHIRDGIYVRPHFVSAPKLDYRARPNEPSIIEPAPATPRPPSLEFMPLPSPGKPGQPS